MQLTTNLLSPSKQKEEDDFSYFYSLFQGAINEMRDTQYPIPSPTSSDSSSRRRRRRRRTSDDESMMQYKQEQLEEPQLLSPADNAAAADSKKRGLKKILSTMLLMDEQEKSDQQELLRSSQHEKSILDDTHRKETQVMLNYYSNFQDYYSEADESDRAHVKKSRISAASKAVSAVAASAANNQTGGGVGQQRRLWVKDRSKAWWDKCNHPDFPESEFRQAFRMSPATFDMICDELNSVVAKEDTMLRAAIPVRQRVAVCIWRLATGEPLRLVSKRFGLGISTCHKLVLEVCLAIKTVLMPKFVQWPDGEAQDSVKKEFEQISGIPNVLGSMYTTHIPIIAPKVSVSSYYNRRHTERNQKTSYSITVQGVVNPKGVFADVCIGWPGSMTDDQILESSALFQRAKAGAMNGNWVVGSAGYPLMDWVLVPYTSQQFDWTQHAFNEKIEEVQRVAKEAFARLKGRWCCLQKRTEVKLQDLPVVLGACCVLHNICEIRNEQMDPELNFELVDDEMVPEVNVRSANAMQTRDKIAHNLLHHGHAGTGFL